VQVQVGEVQVGEVQCPYCSERFPVTGGGGAATA